MSRINMYKWIDGIIRQKEVSAIPIMTHPGIEKIGKTVRDAVCDGTIQAQAVEILAKLYPMAAATTIMDLTVEAEAFGAKIVFLENEVPSVSERLLHNEEDIRNLEIPSLSKGRVPQYLKANLLAAKHIHDRPIFGGCIGPFSLAGRLFDMSEIMMLIYTQPDAANLLLRKCSDFITRYCLALKETGVNGVVMAEPAAGLLSNEDCVKFSSVFVKKIIDTVQDEWFTVMLHNCGNSGNCTQAMVETGAASFHFGNKINMVDALKDIPSNCLAIGNLDPVSLFKTASADEMYKATANLLKATRDYPNFVLSSGCDMPPHTPFANIDAFFAALKDFNHD